MNKRFSFRVWNPLTEKMMSGNNQYGCDEPDYKCIGASSSGAFTRLWEAMARLTQSECVIMQCTGLQDITGRYIYEGDIIEAWGTELVIEYMPEDASFVATSTNFCESGQEWGGNCKVVGNLYEDNEEL
jgi:uncharacterized phage protein (TIGR01671 family)